MKHTKEMPASVKGCSECTELLMPHLSVCARTKYCVDMNRLNFGTECCIMLKEMFIISKKNTDLKPLQSRYRHNNYLNEGY
jgi:hypothetical protein